MLCFRQALNDNPTEFSWDTVFIAEVCHTILNEFSQFGVQRFIKGVHYLEVAKEGGGFGVN